MEKKRKEGERNTSEFMEALMMVKEGTEMLCELADEMDKFIVEQEEFINDLENEIINLDNLLEFERKNKE
jgi:hypothetical protein